MVKNLPVMQKTGVGKMPWRREWQPTPVFLPGEFRGQWRLVGYSLWGCRESVTHFHSHISRRCRKIEHMTKLGNV